MKARHGNAAANAPAIVETATAPEKLCDSAVDALEDIKALDIVVIPLAGKSALADYMIIASGSSSRHVAAIAERLNRRLREEGLKGVTTDGEQQGDWVLIDAGDIIIHVFRPEVRDFYALEKMWGEGAPVAEPSPQE